MNKNKKLSVSWYKQVLCCVNTFLLLLLLLLLLFCLGSLEPYRSMRTALVDFVKIDLLHGQEPNSANLKVPCRYISSLSLVLLKLLKNIYKKRPLPSCHLLSLFTFLLIFHLSSFPSTAFHSYPRKPMMN